MSLSFPIVPVLNVTAPGRYFAKVSTVPTERGCLEWTGALNERGYGWFWPGSAPTTAHRVGFILGGGVLADGDYVLHDCDNPPCQTFDHLYRGTPKDNARDMARRGRQWQQVNPERRMHGECNGRAVLTWTDVAMIREMSADGCSQRELGAIFGVSMSNIGTIVRRETWKVAS